MLALNCRYMQSKWIRSTLHSMTGIHASHGNPPHAKFKFGNILAHDLWKHCLEFTMNVGCYVAHVALGCLHCIRHTVTANSFSLYVHGKQTASPSSLFLHIENSLSNKEVTSVVFFLTKKALPLSSIHIRRSTAQLLISIST